jgi:regulatory protein
VVHEDYEEDLNETSGEKTRSYRQSKKKTPRAYAMDHLARREMSFHELVCRMVKANYAKTEAYAAVLKLQSENLQSDERFVKAFITSRVARGQGPNKIHHDLQAKQVKESLVNRMFADYENQWFDIALESVQKYYNSCDLHDLTMKQKAFQYLLRKGHEIDIIYQVFKAMLNQEEFSPIK